MDRTFATQFSAITIKRCYSNQRSRRLSCPSSLAISNLCNRSDWTESIRRKYFVEPVFYIFLLSQLYLSRLPIRTAVGEGSSERTKF
jgi:hypothetical protein